MHAATPVPVSDTVCGLPLALSTIDRVPLKSSTLGGVKVTFIMQLAPAATLELQVLVWLKSPVVVIFVILSVAEPVLLNLIPCAGLVVLAGSLPNVILVTDKLAVGEPPHAVKKNTAQTAANFLILPPRCYSPLTSSFWDRMRESETDYSVATALRAVPAQTFRAARAELKPRLSPPPCCSRSPRRRGDSRRTG